MSVDEAYEAYLAQDEQVGRHAIASGQLTALRTLLGVSGSFMSELLHTSPSAYRRWEREPAESLMIRSPTAQRVGRFYHRAVEMLTDLEATDYQLSDLIPLHHYAEQRGRPLEQLMVEIREQRLDSVDLGVLGIWVLKDQAEVQAA